MKFRALVSFKDEKNAGDLVRAFFKEFNPESSILIKGKKALLEIFFDKPPMSIAEVISCCEIIEFNYGRTLEEDKEDVAEQEILEDAQQVSAKKDIPKKSNRQSNRRNKNESEIPELMELANKSNSYEEFVKFVVSWLEIEKEQEFFENLVKTAGQVDKITWNNITENFKNNGIVYNEWKKIKCTNQVAAKFKNSKNSVSILQLIKAIVKYKTYDFNHEEEEPKNRIKMNCMPEIPHFEEILGSVDKTQPIEERVRYVLTAMGLEEEKDVEKQNYIYEIANVAVRLKEISNDVIVSKTKIPDQTQIFAWMEFSEFVNGFVKKYDSNRKVKLVDFLKDLQSVIMLESEIETN